MKGEHGDEGSPGSKGGIGPPGIKGEKGIVGPPGSPAPTVGGVTYNRWGSSTCPSFVTLLYAGRMGITSWNQGGSGSYICMPNDPEYRLQYTPGAQGFSVVNGAEYEQSPITSRNQHNAPCAVCYNSIKHTIVMIPAKITCPSGWRREYYGYLVSEHINNRPTKYVCIDNSFESVPGSQNDVYNGGLYHVEASCYGMACPPYNNYKELNCVVCSK